MSSKRPSALAAQLVDPDLYLGDPFALYARLRAEEPVAWNEELGFWALSRHAEVQAVAVNPASFCSSQGILTSEIGRDFTSPPTMMHTDPPAHTRYRRLVQPGFKLSSVRDLEAQVRARADTLIAGIDGGQAIEVVEHLCAPFPLQVIGDLLGLPTDDWRRLYEWSEAVIPGAVDWPEDRRQALMAEMFTYLVSTATQRRTHPGTDMVSILASIETEEGQLSDAELAMFLVQLLVAGNETTRNLLSAGLVALAQAPDQWNQLHADPALVPLAVEELLRFTSPVISFMRTATVPTTIAGQAIGQGEPVLLLYASANRDASVFGADAEQLVVGRHPNPHVAFGYGVHFCLGAALARLEAKVVLEGLLQRFSAVALAGPVTRAPSAVIAGVREATLCFS